MAFVWLEMEFRAGLGEGIIPSRDTKRRLLLLFSLAAS